MAILKPIVMLEIIFCEKNKALVKHSVRFIKEKETFCT